ncbi:MAG TPA: hypothetical protein VEI02_16865, partial [Planctomycetota bacterium]|nr:hypothetical protein [Planctomycetota bacterium]
MRVGIAVVVGAGLLGLAVFLVFGREAAPSETSSPPRDASSTPAASVDVEPTPTVAPGPIATASFADSRPAADRAEAVEAPAVVRGRCVDAETGAPLAGCSVTLRGWPGNEERLSEYVARRGKVAWTDPPALTTGADGRFDLRFAPPPPYQFMTEIAADDRVEMTARWHQVAPGATADLGDVPMARGTRIRGRVVDADGVPQANVALQANLESTPSSDPAPWSGHQFRCGADGAFTYEKRLSAGRYVVRPPVGATSIEPDGFTVAAEESEKVLEFKITRAGATDVITGTVVDDSGAPVARAFIDVSRSRGVVERRLVESKRDGAFAAERGDADPTVPVTLTATLDGYESATTEAPIPWGAKDVKLVMRRGGAIELLVLDGDAGKPLEEYGVRCFPSRETSPTRRSEMSRLREAGAHPGGLCRVRGVVRGTHWLIVEPLDEDRLPSAPHRFEASDTGAPRQVITVFRSVSRTVRVKRTDGTPVVGTSVELVRRVTKEQVIDVGTPACSVDGFVMNGCDRALLIGGGSTDGAGVFALRGPPRETLALRVLGPGHPALVRDVTFDAEDDLDVIVSGGATLTGKIGPPELLPQLHAR